MGERVVRAVGRARRGFVRSFEPAYVDECKACGAFEVFGFVVDEREASGEHGRFSVCRKCADSVATLPAEHSVRAYWPSTEVVS